MKLHDLVNRINMARRAGLSKLRGLPCSRRTRSYLEKLKAMGYLLSIERGKFGAFDRCDVEMAAKLTRIIHHKRSPSISAAKVFDEAKWLDKGRGHMLLDTPRGLLTHVEAIAQNQGGRHIGYVT